MKPRACRYGRNGFFGICNCEACNRIVVITDEMRMEFLVRHHVDVRTPLRYGSHELFIAQATNDDDEPHRTNLREVIDSYLRKEILTKRGLKP